MPERFLPNETPAKAWFVRSVDWPFERAALDVQVDATRRDSPLEWLALRLLTDFADGLPTLAEAAMELGLGDTSLLRHVLAGMLQRGVLARKDPAGEVELSNLVRARGPSPSAEPPSPPPRQAITMHFDAVTGEHRPQMPRRVISAPDHPVVDPAALPPRIEAMGLDRLRRCLRDQEEPALAGRDLTAVDVRTDDGGHVWVPMRLEMAVEATGLLSSTLIDGSEAQQAWLDERDRDIPAMGLGLLTAGPRDLADESSSHLTVPFAAWFARARQLIDPLRVAAEIHTLIDSARKEVVTSAEWFALPRWQKQLMAKADRKGSKIQVVVCAEGNADIADPEVNNLQLIRGGEDGELPRALVVDGRRAIIVDWVALQTPNGHRRVVQIASFVCESSVPSIRARLLGQAESADAEPV